VQIDSNLTWQLHVEDIKKKISSTLSVLKKLKPILDQHCLCKIYKSIVEPYFNYCCLVWDGFDKNLAETLQNYKTVRPAS